MPFAADTWVRSPVSQARTQIKYYYAQRLMQRSFWLKLLSGQVAISALSSLWRSISLASSRAASAPKYQQQMASAMAAFTGAVLLLLSESYYTAKEFVEFTEAAPDWRAALGQARMQRHTLPDADHTLSTASAKANSEGIVLGWLQEHFAATVDEAISDGSNSHESL